MLRIRLPSHRVFCPNLQFRLRHEHKRGVLWILLGDGQQSTWLLSPAHSERKQRLFRGLLFIKTSGRLAMDLLKSHAKPPCYSQTNGTRRFRSELREAVIRSPSFSLLDVCLLHGNFDPQARTGRACPATSDDRSNPVPALRSCRNLRPVSSLVEMQHAALYLSARAVRPGDVGWFRSQHLLSFFVCPKSRKLRC